MAHGVEERLAPGQRVSFLLGKGTDKGTIVRVNGSSVLVELSNGAAVKRHIWKHRVERINSC